MAYVKQNVIRASDFNSFKNQVIEVYGVGSGDFGYGETAINIPDKSPGDTISETEWTQLREAILACATHQGSSTNELPPASEFASGEVIEAHEQDSPTSDQYDLDTVINRIRSNRFNTNSGASMSLINAYSHQRGTAWSSEINAIQRLAWNDEDSARHFFNSGGEIRMSFNHPQGNAQDDNWSQVCDDIGEITFTRATTSVSGTAGTGTSIGYYDLGSSFTRIYDGTNIGTGAYSANDVFVDARRVNYSGTRGGNGSGIEFRITFRDEHSNIYSDSVQGGTTVQYTEFKADVELNNIDSPDYTTQDQF